jgi:hypothetical protein
MSSKDEYISNLSWRLGELKAEIVDLQKTIQSMFKEVEQKQEQAQYLLKLLKAEGIDIQDPELASLTDTAIADIAYDYLKNENTKTPLHYNDLAKAIMEKGILIPGKIPSSNLLSHINRDDRFVRTAPGTYGLKEWGVTEMPQRRRKPKKRKR